MYHFSCKRGRDVNKTELIDRVAETVSITKADSNRAIDAVLDAIAKALKSGDTVTLIGFGTFLVRSRKARTGRNPQTGKEIQIPASLLPAFRPGKALKDEVNHGKN